MSVLAYARAVVKHRMPRVTRAYRAFQTVNRTVLNRVRSVESVFTDIYSKNGWANEETVSGSGSTLESTEAIREQLPLLFREFGFRALLDAPCGDYHWMRETRLDLDAYWGMDIVPEIVARNAQRYGSQRVRFVKGDLIEGSLPKVDVILCRDCFNHLSFSAIASALRNFKRSGSGYVLLTTDVYLEEAADIVNGQSRSLNLQSAPISLPAPVRLLFDGPKASLNRNDLDKRVSGRRLGLWKLSDLFQ